jgi:Enoyl-(Acyl carrier protein) reductase
VDAITGVLARELGPKKIRVNALNPGMVETEGTHTGGVIGSDFESTVVAQTPLGRIGQPGDIGPIAVFLASDESGWLTGEQILASGGKPLNQSFLAHQDDLSAHGSPLEQLARAGRAAQWKPFRYHRADRLFLQHGEQSR